LWLNEGVAIGAIGRAAAALTVAASGLLPAVAAAAAPGTWGAGHYAYAAGRVCHPGPQTAPLAAWPVSGGHVGYLTREVVSDGHVDSAAPPVAAAGTAQPAAPVGPGAEFAGEQDIAAVAYLLDAGGDAATLATAVLAQTDPGGLPPCADRAAAAEQLDRARRLAGPYEVTVTPPAGKLRPGAATTVTATVRTTAGAPVPDAKVAFTSDDAAFAAATVRTDDRGDARARVRVRAGAPPTVTVTATVKVATGLLEATVVAKPSPTLPSGASVPAVYPAPATAYSGATALPVDESAHPVVSTALANHLFAANKPFVPKASLTGLNGHSADVTFDLLGPLPMADRTLCSGVAARDWTKPDVHIATTSAVTVSGDGPVTGGALTAGQPGCYALRTKVATVDASPAVVKTAPLTVVAVLDTTVTRTDDQPAVASARQPATLTGGVRVVGTHGLRGTVRAVLAGPIRPADGNCTADAPAWAKAARHTVATEVHSLDSTATSVVAAGGYEYRFPAPTADGCYRVHPALTLTAAGGDTLTVSADDRAAYVLDPTVSAAVRQTWAVSPAPVPVDVEVDGLYGLAAHVRLAMYRTPADPAGCGQASFTEAARAGDGPDAAVPARPGPVSVAAETGPTPEQGCYAVVPELTVDAAPTVRIAGPLGAPGSTLIAGADPTQHRPTASGGGGGSTPLSFVIALGVLAGLLVAVAARVAFVAWREREGPPGVAWDAFRGEVLHLPDQELPSDP
jgi:hypothetical protein